MDSIKIPAEIREEWEILTAGTVDVLPAEDFRDKLLKAKRENRPLRIKLGADPSAPDLHLGHSVQLNKLRQFQELGHQVVFIVGDFTARIGDPTGKSETRPALSAEAVAQNAATYMDQLWLILDRAKTEVVWNGSWFDTMCFTDVIKLASQYTVARMLERDDFSKRYADNRPIHIHEFLYPLVQGYDSVMVRADLELGGTDQKFNLLVGRELMREADMDPQCIMTLPLLVGLDGVHKMSKSLGNYIGLTESADEIFGKAMSVPDEMMRDYLVLTLGYKPVQAEGLLSAVEAGQLHPRDLKARIGEELAAKYRGPEAGAAARERFDRVFKEREIPENIDSITLECDNGSLAMLKVLTHPAVGLAKSGGEARRLIQQGGVSLDGQKITAQDHNLRPGEYLLKVGKRHFKRINLT
jgi:tyrosyl-tRNA synthetase